MNRLLLILLCSAAPWFCAATPEKESRRIVRESVEWMFGESVTPTKWKRWQRELKPALDALPKDIRMSEYCEILAEKMDDLAFVNHIISVFLDNDGVDVTSSGNAEALELTRKALEIYGGTPSFCAWIAHRYLALKGDERDTDLLHKSVHVGANDIECLAQRIAGTNVICRLVRANGNISEGKFSVAPSVANTGPQGVYVEAILMKYWEQLGTRKQPTWNWLKEFPDELLAMVVWFDEGGNPVCNVDLEKYGVAMPVLNASVQGMATPPPVNRLWLYVGCVFGLLLLSLLLWAKARCIAWAIVRALRNPLFCALRCSVFVVVAWVCCWLSGEMWSWRVDEHMEIDGPYYYSGFPIWFIRTAAHGSVGGGTCMPIRVYLNMAVWFMFWLSVRGLLTGRMIRSIPVSLIPIWRRVVFCLLMGLIPFILFLALLGTIDLQQKWPYWCVLVAIPALIVVSLKWLRTGYVFVKRTNVAPIPWNRWFWFLVGITFIILISISFNKVLPAQSATSSLPFTSTLMFYVKFYLILLCGTLFS